MAMPRSSTSPSRLVMNWLYCLAIIGGVTSATSAWGQRDLRDIPVPDPEIERETFIVADGFEVNLFAADPLLAKPIQMSFDAAGRLWVAGSEVYPHIKPGQVANDKIIVLEDTNGDGEADKTTVFADGLLIPTGVLPGDGGAYVVNSTELLHLSDTNGDGQADERRVVLTGFGTEDTHHLLHSLRWGPDGAMYMNQSIYIHSHIETPHGVRRLNGGGIWRFRPETMQLDVFSRGFVNAWGHHFDAYGQSFATDGAYVEGINYVFPGSVFVTAVGATRVVAGLNPGSPKHCGLEILSGRHLPDDWQGNMITNDFRAHRVCRFVVTEDGSGFASRQEVELIKSSHIAFRPVDVRMGPDGAIYIADWYNPIIQHGEVDFRDPRRDQVHGRIWRVTAKNRPLVEHPRLVDATVPELLDHLRSPEQWVRLQAKLQLKERGANVVEPLLAQWLAKLDARDPDSERLHLEGLWTYQGIGRINQALLEQVLVASDHRVRAAAMRVVPQWKHELSGHFDMLARGVRDPHPRVRLEAVRGLAEETSPQAAATALVALDQPIDRFLDFALWQTMRDLAPIWLPLVQRGELDFEGQVDRLTFALQAADSPDVARPLLNLVRGGRIIPERRDGVLQLVARLGGEEELGELLSMILEGEVESSASQMRLLEAMSETYRLRKVAPAGDLNRISQLFQADDLALRQEALRAVGTFQVRRLGPAVETVARKSPQPELRLAAIESLGRLDGDSSRQLLEELAADSTAPVIRLQAIRSLAAIDAASAAEQAIAWLTNDSADSLPESLTSPMVSALLAQKDGVRSLVQELTDRPGSLDADVARRLVRNVRESGQSAEELIAALEYAGGLAEAGWKMSEELTNQLIAESRLKGDPVRGEAIYRRGELQCLKCHAIGGAGGRVGPDLTSIGASAQPDYLVESILAPNAKIKENYHSIVVIADGKVATGIPLRRTEKELVLRDAQDQEIVIAVDAIEEEFDGRSLMPDGTVDSLTRDELVDLVRFLSELGKVGEYAVGTLPVVRDWEALLPTLDAQRRIRRTSFDTVASTEEVSEFAWQRIPARVAGDLPIEELPRFQGVTYAQSESGADIAFVRTRIETNSSGRVQLDFSATEGLTLWVNAQPTPLIKRGEPLELTLPAGDHQITIAVDTRQRSAPLRLVVRTTEN
jgi:putative heme-binding domain-containing protein